MSKRDYDATGIINRRMNEIMNILLLAPMEISDLCAKMRMEHRAIRKYLTRMKAEGKVAMQKRYSDRRYKVWELIQGAMPYEPTSPKPKPRRPRGSPPLKRGPKPAEPKSTEGEDRKVKTVPAQQVGIKRDPMVAMLFG